MILSLSEGECGPTWTGGGVDLQLIGCCRMAPCHGGKLAWTVPRVPSQIFPIFWVATGKRFYNRHDFMGARTPWVEQVVILMERTRLLKRTC
jgi:hypothetical protein